MDQLYLEHPILGAPPADTVTFTFDGQSLSGRAGEPIAAALARSGVSAFRHTHKTGQPRGIFCGIGQCSDCMVVINGHPNLRACITPLEAGMAVETQRGFGKVGAV